MTAFQRRCLVHPTVAGTAFVWFDAVLGTEAVAMRQMVEVLVHLILSHAQNIFYVHVVNHVQAPVILLFGFSVLCFFEIHVSSRVTLNATHLLHLRPQHQ